MGTEVGHRANPQGRTPARYQARADGRVEFLVARVGRGTHLAEVGGLRGDLRGEVAHKGMKAADTWGWMVESSSSLGRARVCMRVRARVPVRTYQEGQDGAGSWVGSARPSGCRTIRVCPPPPARA